MARERDEHGEPRDVVKSGMSTPLLIGGTVIGLLLLAGVGFGLWYFLGRGESTAAVIEQYRPRFAEQRARLRKLVAQLPPAGSVQGDTLPGNLDPKPVYDVPNKKFNVVILMANHCEDPDRDLKKPTEFDLLLEEDEFRTHLLWTGDRSPLVESARKAPAKDLSQRLDRSLDIRYLVVARTVKFEPPRVVKEDTFVGGDLDLEVFLFDYRNEKQVGAFRRSLRPDAQVMVEFRKDRKESESAEAFVYSNVWSKARKEVAETLARGTGGTFVIDRTK